MSNSTTDKENFLNRILHQDMEPLLDQMGIAPDHTSIKNQLAIYLKPFKHAALYDYQVIVKGNKWHFKTDPYHKYNLVDFLTLRLNCGIGMALDHIARNCSIPSGNQLHPDFHDPHRFYPIQVMTKGPLVDTQLISRTLGGNLPKALLENHLQQYDLQSNDQLPKYQIALGLAGQDATNNIILIDRIQSSYPLIMECSSNPSPLIIDRGGKYVDLFESLQDYIHYLNFVGKESSNDTVILPDVLSLEPSRKLLEKYNQVNIFLKSSPLQNLHKGYLQWLGPKYNDFSLVYKNKLSITEESQEIAQKQKHTRGYKL